MPLAASASAQPCGEPGAERGEVDVGVGGEHLGERGQPGRAHERVAVERALVGGAPADHLHHVGPAAEGRRGRAAADRLGEAREVGLHAVALDRAAGRDRRARLHLVEDQQRAVPVQQLEQAREVSGLGLRDADVHHHRLDDQARDRRRRCSSSSFDEHGEVVERHRVRVAAQVLRHAERHRLRRGCFAPAHEIGVRHDGEHHRVVMTVVRAFDLHDVVAAGRHARNTGSGPNCPEDATRARPAKALLEQPNRLILRRLRSAVSKDGHQRGCSCPPFETRPLRAAPQGEVYFDTRTLG